MRQPRKKTLLLLLAIAGTIAGALWAQVPPPPPDAIFDPTEEIRADSILSLPADI